jgi:hypothetical protein
MSIQLCPVQQIAFDTLIRERSRHRILELHSSLGHGRSTVLQQLCLALGGVLLDIGSLVERLRQKYVSSLEETFEQLTMNALTQHSIVLLDDLHLFRQLILCSHAEPNDDQLFRLALTRCSNYAKAVNKNLVLCYWSDYGTISSLTQTAYQVRIAPFQEEDYAFFCYHYLQPAIASGLNFERIFYTVPNLNGYQLKKACIALRQEEALNTNLFIQYLTDPQYNPEPLERPLRPYLCSSYLL